MAVRESLEGYSHVVVVERMCNGTPEQVFDRFVEQVWKRIDGLKITPRIVEEGDENLVGNIRQVPVAIQEKILSVVPGKEVKYTIISGPVPLKKHLGTVTFSIAKSSDQASQASSDTPQSTERTNTDDGDSTASTSGTDDSSVSTLVQWRCDFTPYWGLGLLLPMMLRMSFAAMLRPL